MKKLVNNPDAAVREMVEGLVAVYPGLRRLQGSNVLVRSDAKPGGAKVAVISGGGSGHEPAHAGYIGRGMLDAAVLGEVFSSPTSDAVNAALRAVAGPSGAVLIVKNYMGDRLNFGLAAEIARSEGIPVEVVVVADDVALAESTDPGARRGLAGTILVHKVAGAAAESGANLARVAAEARAMAAAVRTMGVALGPCTLPAVGKPGFTLGETEIELGLGIHGEAGVRRGPIEPADALVDRMLTAIRGDLDMIEGERIALMVNNLGGSTTMELAIVARRAIARLEKQQLAVERVYLGTFLSALEMAGMSLSVLKLTEPRLERLDAPTDAPAWPNASSRPRNRAKPPVDSSDESETWPATSSTQIGQPRTKLGRAVDVAVIAATSALTAASSRLNDLDQAVGDGDLGTSLTRAAQAVRGVLPTLVRDDPLTTLHGIGLALQRSAGGTSGPLYAAFFIRAAGRFRAPVGHPPIAPDDLKGWVEAFRAGCAAIAEMGGAAPGDRTMLDALQPAADALGAAVDAGKPLAEALHLAAAAAEAGAKATASMHPKRGRSRYLGDRVLGKPDPGAEAVAIWLRALAGS